MGDPTGIGPETIVSALNDERVYQVCEPFVVGPSPSHGTRH